MCSSPATDTKHQGSHSWVQGTIYIKEFRTFQGNPSKEKKMKRIFNPPNYDSQSRIKYTPRNIPKYIFLYLNIFRTIRPDNQKSMIYLQYKI